MLTLKKNVFTNEKCVIEISRDQLSAVLDVNPFVQPTPDDVLLSLRLMGVNYGIVQLDKIVEFLNEPARFGNKLVVAQGKPFTIGAAGTIEFFVDFHPVCAPGFAENFSPWNGSLMLPDELCTVNKGAIIAIKTLPRRGEPGITVFGTSIPGEWGLDTGIKGGANVEISADGAEFIALADGLPVLKDDALMIAPLLVFDGDLYPEDGKIKHDGTVFVKRSIHDRCSLNVTGDIIVNGDIRNSHIKAGGNVVCGGTITSGEKMIAAAGFVIAGKIIDASVESQKGVVAEEEIVKSIVCANGKVETRKVVGGTIIAHENISVERIENDGARSADLMAGFHFKIQKAYKNSLDELRNLQKEVAALQKEFEASAKKSKSSSVHLDSIKAQIFSRIERIKKIQEDIPMIRKLRKFNPMSVVEAKTAIASCTQISLGDFNYSVKNRIGRTTFRWNSLTKKPQIINNDRGDATAGQAIAQNTVLIIDDSKEIRSLLRFICESLDLFVIGEAEDGREGVDKFISLRPSLVTCDISMVNMDGLAALKEIREISKEAKVIMISATKEKEMVNECIVSGAMDYIVKPFTPNKVRTVLKTAFLS